MMELSEKIRIWATTKNGSRSELANQLATALEDENEQSRWSLINLRAEFDARPRTRSESESARAALLAAGYLVPVLIAWWHLRAAFNSYSSAVNLAGTESAINFLAFWTGAYRDQKWGDVGTTAQAAAWQIVGIVVLLVVATFISARAESHRVGREDAELDNLILEASLALAKWRVVRPEEMAENMREATHQLEMGLHNMRTALDETRSVIDGVAQLSISIEGSTKSLENASTQLSDSMAPLKNFGDVAQHASAALESAGLALAVAEKTFSSAVAESASSAGAATQGIIRNIQVAQETMTVAVEGSARSAGVATNEMIRALDAAQTVFASAIDQSAESIAAVRSGIETAARVIRDAGTGFGDVVESSDAVVDRTKRVVGEIELAVTKFGQIGSLFVDHANSMRIAVDQVVATGREFEKLAASVDSAQGVSVLTELTNLVEPMVRAAEGVDGAVAHLSNELRRWSDANG